MTQRTVTLLLVLLATNAPSSQKEAYQARVVAISDGDTLTVLKADRTQVKIRLNGIDAPETGQDFGAKAKEAASALAFGKDVTVHEVDKDRYGRTVADVVLPDGRLLNHELVRDGFAWHYVRYAPNDEELKRLEKEARTAKRGLWSQADPIPPWEWRKPKVDQVGGVIANRSSMLYHAPNCRGAAKMKESNRVIFRTAKEAEAAGYRKAGDCK